MRGGSEEAVAFGDGFADELEFGVFKVAEAPVDHTGRFGTGPRGKVVLIDEDAGDALHGEVADQARAVNAAAENEDVAGPAALEIIPNVRAFLHMLPPERMNLACETNNATSVVGNGQGVFAGGRSEIWNARARLTEVRGRQGRMPVSAARCRRFVALSQIPVAWQTTDR